MGLFRDLGRRAERFKQQLESATDATHECVECGTLLASDAEACPECGGDVASLD